MDLEKNDIKRLFPSLDMNQFSFLPLLEDFFDGIIVTDEYGRVRFVNEEQARIDDMPAKDLLGKKVTDIYHVDDGISPTLQCIKTGRSIKGLACYYRTCTGKIVNSIHNIFPLFEGSRLFGTICFIQDFSIIEQRFEAVFQPETIRDLQGIGPLRALKRGLPLANGTRFRFQDIIGESREFLDCV
ncbi:MAG: PAS domain-containing protein, partial [Proteobacteria bacterium]|nr:PAS domain-containing protein [Pseudomonadota bacterium]